MAMVMAIDDALIIRKLVQSTLEQQGHQVICFEGGVQAIKYVRENPVDLVISDVHMPGMQGTSVVKQIRAIAHCENIPIIMLSTETSGDWKKKAREYGADGWINKPFNVDRFNHAVKTILTRFGHDDAAANDSASADKKSG